jgi:predicted HAD superfamily Cof-like phosphohydrolase
MSRENSVAEFHFAMKQPINEDPIKTKTVELGFKLIAEEYAEFRDEVASALAEINMHERISVKTKGRLLKELADLQYVVSGFAVRLGLPLEQAFNRVHKSNMSKLDDDGNPIYREDGKVVKGPNYRPVDLEDLVDG